jgi:hypothetical protein
LAAQVLEQEGAPHSQAFVLQHLHAILCRPPRGSPKLSKAAATMLFLAPFLRYF